MYAFVLVVYGPSLREDCEWVKTNGIFFTIEPSWVVLVDRLAR